MTPDENETVREILRSIIAPIHDRGGSGEEIMVLLGSVTVGILLTLSSLYPGMAGKAPLLADALADGVILRLVDLQARERADEMER